METILNYLIPSAMADTPCPLSFSGFNYGHMGGVGMIIFWILDFGFNRDYLPRKECRFLPGR